MKTPRLTKQSIENIRAADEFSLHDILINDHWHTWAMVYRQGMPAQLHAGNGPMMYRSQLAALRALDRINPGIKRKTQFNTEDSL